MSLPPFQLHRPRTMREALTLLSAHDDDAALYMGGTELLLLMKLGFASPGHLVDGKAIRELTRFSVDDDLISIGAGVTHRRIERHRDVQRLLPSLARLASQVANVRVRNVGTLGGNLCFAEPHSDPVTLLIALGASVQLTSSRGERSLPLEEFCTGAFNTALESSEVMVSVEVRVPKPHAIVGYERLAFKERPDVAAAVVVDGGTCAVVVGAVGPRPLRIKAAEEALEASDGAEIEPAVTAVQTAVADAGVDDYRAHLAGVMVRRAHASGILSSRQ